jgi:hypothetical protein
MLHQVPRLYTVELLMIMPEHDPEKNGEGGTESNSYHFLLFSSRDNPVGIATDYFPTSSGAHPPSYPKRKGGFFSDGKAAGAWSWPLKSN